MGGGFWKEVVEDVDVEEEGVCIFVGWEGEVGEDQELLRGGN